MAYQFFMLRGLEIFKLVFIFLKLNYVFLFIVNRKNIKSQVKKVLTQVLALIIIHVIIIINNIMI